jgi:hypothetical protein
MNFDKSGNDGVNYIPMSEGVISAVADAAITNGHTLHETHSAERKNG